MNIWKILGTDPTTDKKAIRQAYAAKTKEIHPEEKPEDFKRLHEAYQAALRYADHLRRVSLAGGSVTSFYLSDEEDADDAADEKTGQGEEKLRSYFEEKKRRQRRRVDAFLNYWNAMQNPHDNPEMFDWWKEYLASEEFQDIRSQPQVLYVLSRELDKKFFYRINDLKILFWDAYQFQENEENKYQGEMRQIWKSLYPAFQKQQQTIRDKQKQDENKQNTAEETNEKSGQEEEKLLSYFEENQEKHEQRIDAFLKYWVEMQSPYRDPEMLNRLQAYLASDEFQEIRFHTKVLFLLAEEIDDKCLYGINEIKMLFWDAYGFQEGEENVYQGDRQRLYRSLYPAYEIRQQDILNERKRAKRNRLMRIFAGVSAAVVVGICVLALVNTHMQRAKERRFLIDYMARQYPETTFSEPERLGEDGIGGDIVYTMRSLAHPELTTTVMVKCRYVKGKKQYQVTEDYGQQIFAYYAAQYGLDARTELYCRLIYPKVEEIDAFCETVERMFHEQKELQAVPEVVVGTEDVLFPLVLQYGGMSEFQFTDMQAYDLRTMEAEELSEELREAFMLYMFLYEPWNITTQQYREWGASYEKRSGEWEDENGEWHEVYDPDTGEYLCRFFLSTYQNYDGFYAPVGGKPGMPRKVRMMTVGNAYYFLQERGANLTVRESGDGFDVTLYGTVRQFGFEPEVKFDELRDWY